MKKIALLFVLYVCFAGASLGCAGTGQQIYDFAKDAKILKEEIKQEYTEYFDNQGKQISKETADGLLASGEVVTAKDMQAYERQWGETADNAADAAGPLGKTVLTVTSFIAALLGLKEGVKVVRTRVLNPKTEETT